MNILLIYAHPSDESFNHATKEAFIRGALKAGHKVDLIDLHKDQFDPVLKDTNSRAPLSPEIMAYQERVTAADCLVFVYPTFWYRTPAILAGWIDRVFTSRFAYQYVPTIFGFKRPIGLLKPKKAVVIESYGGPAWYYNFIFWQAPWRIFKATLKFCGIKKFFHQPHYYVPFGTEKRRKLYLEKVERLASRI